MSMAEAERFVGDLAKNPELLAQVKPQATGLAAVDPDPSGVAEPLVNWATIGNTPTVDVDRAGVQEDPQSRTARLGRPQRPSWQALYRLLRVFASGSRRDSPEQFIWLASVAKATPPYLDDVLRRLESLRTLEVDWDSYWATLSFHTASH